MVEIQEFTKDDIKFIAKITKLTVKNAEKLLEEPRDSNLLLDSISELKFGNKSLQTLSFATMIKLAVFRYSKNIECEVEEKEYIANSIVSELPKIVRQKNLLIDELKPNEKHSRYFLILLGFFEDFLMQNNKKYSLNRYLNFIEAGFLKGGQRGVSERTNEWYRILKEIKKNHENLF